MNFFGLGMLCTGNYVFQNVRLDNFQCTDTIQGLIQNNQLVLRQDGHRFLQGAVQQEGAMVGVHVDVGMYGFLL